MSEEIIENEVSEVDTEEQKRIEHENFLKSFPESTVFFDRILEKDDVQWLGQYVKDAVIADRFGWSENHLDESELTLIDSKYYLKGHEKTEDVQEEIDKKAAIIDHQIEELLDTTVQSRRYKNVESCMTYYNSTDKTFREESEAVLKWRDSLYSTAREILRQVKAGEIDFRIVYGVWGNI